MTDLDWSTPDGLAAIRDHLAARDRRLAPAGRARRGAQPRVVVAGVGVRARQRARAGAHGLAAVVLATVLGHDGSTATLPVSRHQLAAAVESLEPAEACTDVDHPNLAAWREVLLELEGNPAREAQAVFVADLDDPVTSEADGSMRATFEGHAPEAVCTRGAVPDPSRPVRARGRLHSPPESANNGVSTLQVRVTILTGPVRVWCPGDMSRRHPSRPSRAPPGLPFDSRGRNHPNGQDHRFR